MALPSILHQVCMPHINYRRSDSVWLLTLYVCHVFIITGIQGLDSAGSQIQHLHLEIGHIKCEILYLVIEIRHHLLEIL